MADIRPFATIEQAVAALQALPLAGARATGAWTLPQVLVHLAQSVEFSMAGFPEMKPAIFRATLGRAAFAVFDARGAMSHPLDQPIPGAPALAAERDLAAARARLIASLQAFQSHAGPLQPHFAYGDLDHAAYARAHLMHLGQHWSEIQLATVD